MTISLMGDMVPKIDLNDLSSKDPKIKYGCAKRLLALAREDPIALYPQLDLFIDLMDGENRILEWTAIDVIGFLSKVDTDDRIDGIIERLFRSLDSGNMITANHAISALSQIALIRPDLQQKITDELIKVEHYDYETDECRNIALGKVMIAIGPFFDQLKDRDRVISLVERQIRNTRNATKKKAESFLRKHSGRKRD